MSETLEPKLDAPEVKPKYQEGQVLSVNYSPSGPVRVVWRDGKQRVEHAQPDPHPVIPGGMSRKELLAFYNYCNVADHLLGQEGRKLPVMLQEVKQVIPKPVIKNLSHKGLIEIQTLQMKNDKKETHSYAFCWLTGLGLGLRAQFEAARKANEAQPDAEGSVTIPESAASVPEVQNEAAPHSD